MAAAHSGTPFDLAHTIGTSLLVLGVALLVSRLAPRTSAVVLGAGAMTLTLYTLHVVLRTPSMLSEDSTSTFYVHVAVVLGLGAAFRLLRLRGPLEVFVGQLASNAASSWLPDERKLQAGEGV